MAKKQDNVIAVSLSQEFFQVVQIKGRGLHGKVLNVFAKDLSSAPEEQRVKIIRSGLHSFNTKNATVVYVIPQSITTTKTIEVPSINTEEIKSIVNLQAGRHTPFSREEIQVGFINLGVHNNNYTKVLLAITNKTEIKTAMSLFEKAGVDIQQVVFAPEGIARLYSKALQLESNPNPSGIIDIGQKSTDFIITHKGTVIAARNIPIERQQLSQNGPMVKDKLIEELSQTMESFKNEDLEGEPVKYFLTQSDDLDIELQGLIKEKLGWDTETVPYLDQVKASQGVVKKIAKDFSDSSFLSVIGPAALFSDLEVNLMPDEVELKKTVQMQGRQVFRTAVLLFILLFLGSVFLGVKIFFQSSFLKKMKRDHSAQRQAVVSLQERASRSQIVQTFIENRMISLDIIRELYNKVPVEIYLTNISMDETGTIHVQGISDIPSLVFNLGTTLKESDLFKSVEIGPTTSKKDRGKDVTAFEIILKNIYAIDDEETASEDMEETP